MPIDRANWREALKKRFSPQNAGFWCGDGWKEIICDLYDALEKIDVQYTIAQIKEKLGGLRYYVDVDKKYFNEKDESKKGPLDEPFKTFYQLIHDAEARSLTVCEQCGKPGQRRGGSLIRTLCDACEVIYQKTQAEYIRK